MIFLLITLAPNWVNMFRAPHFEMVPCLQCVAWLAWNHLVCGFIGWGQNRFKSTKTTQFLKLNVNCFSTWTIQLVLGLNIHLAHSCVPAFAILCFCLNLIPLGGSYIVRTNLCHDPLTNQGNWLWVWRWAASTHDIWNLSPRLRHARGGLQSQRSRDLPSYGVWWCLGWCWVYRNLPLYAKVKEENHPSILGRSNPPWVWRKTSP